MHLAFRQLNNKLLSIRNQTLISLYVIYNGRNTPGLKQIQLGQADTNQGIV